MLNKFNTTRSVLRRAYAREYRRISGTDYTIAYYTVHGFDEFRRLSDLWQFIGATTFVTERMGAEQWECELRFPRRGRYWV